MSASPPAKESLKRSAEMTTETTTDTATAFDVSYYPHIMDDILANAPYESLLRLRATCREFKKRVDERLLHHVHVVDRTCWEDDRKNIRRALNDLVQTIDGHRLPMFGLPTPGCVELDRPSPKIVDIMTATRCDIGTLKPDTIRTYERGRPFYPYNPPLQHACVRRHVHFINLALTSDYEPPMSYYIKKLVLNIQYDQEYHLWTYHSINISSFMIKIEQLVIIFDYFGPRGSLDLYPDRIRDSSDLEREPYPAIFGEVVFLSTSIWRNDSSHRLIIVNYPASKELNSALLPRDWGGNFDLHNDPVGFRDTFRQGVKADLIRMQSWPGEVRFSPEKIQAIVDSIEFLDLDTYKARVGETEFNAETDRSSFQNWKR